MKWLLRMLVSKHHLQASPTGSTGPSLRAMASNSNRHGLSLKTSKVALMVKTWELLRLKSAGGVATTKTSLASFWRTTKGKTLTCLVSKDTIGKRSLWQHILSKKSWSSRKTMSTWEDSRSFIATRRNRSSIQRQVLKLRSFTSSRAMSLSAWQFWTQVRMTENLVKSASPYSAMVRSIIPNPTAAPSASTLNVGPFLILLRAVKMWKPWESRRSPLVDGVRVTSISQVSSWRTAQVKSQDCWVWRGMHGNPLPCNKSQF